MATTEYRYHRRALPRHRPLLLRAGDIPGATPVRIFVVVLALTAPVSVWSDVSIANPLQLAYAIAIGNYLARKYEEYLDGSGSTSSGICCLNSVASGSPAYPIR